MLYVFRLIKFSVSNLLLCSLRVHTSNYLVIPVVLRVDAWAVWHRLIKSKKQLNYLVCSSLSPAHARYESGCQSSATCACIRFDIYLFRPKIANTHSAHKQVTYNGVGEYWKSNVRCCVVYRRGQARGKYSKHTIQIRDSINSNVFHIFRENSIESIVQHSQDAKSICIQY